MAENPQRRRAVDRVDPDVQLAINDGDADTRHLLRNEFAAGLITLRADLAAVRQDVQVGNLAQVTETARMQESLKELKSDVADLKTLEPRVRTLEAGAVATREVAALKRWVIGAAAIPSLAIIAAYLTQHS